MLLILRRPWEAIDASDPENPQDTIIPAGVHEVERIDNPFGRPAPWIVLEGTKIGATRGSWTQWEDSPGDDQVTIIEGGLDEWVERALTNAKAVLDEPVVDPSYLSAHARAGYKVLAEGGTEEKAREAIATYYTCRA